MKLVVDASVVVKWFVEEDGHPEALAIFERGDECFAPDLVVVEVAGALDKKIKAGTIDSEQAFEAIGKVQSEMTMVAGSRLIERALGLASELNHPVADCLYLACALELDACVVTADNSFMRKAIEKGYRSHILGLYETLRTQNLGVISLIDKLEPLLSAESMTYANIVENSGKRGDSGFSRLLKVIPQNSNEIANSSVPLLKLRIFLNSLKEIDIRILGSIYKIGSDVEDKMIEGIPFSLEIDSYFVDAAPSIDWKSLSSEALRAELSYLALGIWHLKPRLKTSEDQ